MTLEMTREQFVLLSSAQSTSPNVQRRLEALLLLGQRYQVQVVAQRLQVSPKTVYKWFHAFQRNGLQGLRDHQPALQLRNLDEGYRRCLEQTLAVPTRRWSVERLQHHLYQQTGVRLSEASLARVLNALGYTYQRVECWRDGELVFAGSTWVQASQSNSTGRILIYTIAGDGSVRVHEGNRSELAVATLRAIGEGSGAQLPVRHSAGRAPGIQNGFRKHAGAYPLIAGNQRAALGDTWRKGIIPLMK
jgi:transposase